MEKPASCYINRVCTQRLLGNPTTKNYRAPTTGLPTTHITTVPQTAKISVIDGITEGTEHLQV